jgi:hypothetical protein
MYENISNHANENTGSRIPSVEGAACVATATAQGATTLLSAK